MSAEAGPHVQIPVRDADRNVPVPDPVGARRGIPRAPPRSPARGLAACSGPRRVRRRTPASCRRSAARAGQGGSRGMDRVGREPRATPEYAQRFTVAPGNPRASRREVKRGMVHGAMPLGFCLSSRRRVSHPSPAPGVRRTGSTPPILYVLTWIFVDLPALTGPVWTASATFARRDRHDSERVATSLRLRPADYRPAPAAWASTCRAVSADATDWPRVRATRQGPTATYHRAAALGTSSTHGRRQRGEGPSKPSGSPTPAPGDRPSAVGVGSRSCDPAPWRPITLLTCSNSPNGVKEWRIRPGLVTSAGVVYRRPLGDLVLRLCGEFGG